MLLSLIGVALMLLADLPTGSAPAPVPLPHFPSRLHAFVWRNWQLVPTARMAQVVGAQPEEIRRLGAAMGLPAPPRVSADQWRRSYLTIIRRNWHLLPYAQLLTLLDWTPEQMAFTLREDDFLFIKLGSLKPKCEPIRYRPSDTAMQARERALAEIARREFPALGREKPEPLFAFVKELSRPEPSAPRAQPPAYRFSPRFCYSYFALYGDPLLDTVADPFPDGYLARLAQAGVNGVWLQAVLHKMAPFPWDEGQSAQYENRLANLRKLVARAKKRGIGIYLYLNEPRAWPHDFYASRPELKGAAEGDHAALCTSAPEVRRWLTDSIASICRAVPDIAGFFTITASENLTNCWSHYGGAACPRCSRRSPAEVIAEVNRAVQEGIRQADSRAQLIAWDWGWQDEWAEKAIEMLPQEAALMSVSEWSLPIRRGSVEHSVGEYSISAVGPGPRAKRHWAAAKKRGLKTLAKIQAGCTWELSTVPYIPALENVAQHAANLLAANVDGMMLGWTLGGFPSPNLEVVAEISRAEGSGALSPDARVSEALRRVAAQRFGNAAAPAVVEAWRGFSAAFREFPYDGALVYNAPMQFGPSNLLWGEPTGYRATMVGFPYDDLDGWRGVYPPEVFVGQFTKVADGFDRALARLRESLPAETLRADTPQRRALEAEMRVAEAAALHFRSTANQARFVLARRAAAQGTGERKRAQLEMEGILKEEIATAKRLHALQIRDSRLGFEASNQYSYVPLDLIEKVLNCHDLLSR